MVFAHGFISIERPEKN